MVQITGELHGLGKVDAFMAEIIRRGEKAGPLMQAIGFYNEQATRERIAVTNVGPDGKPWKQSGRARADGGKTLFASHGLHDSITSEATDTTATWGTNKIYGPIHQVGGKIEPRTGKALRFPVPGGGFVKVKSVTIPARPYLGISPADQTEIGGLIWDYFFAGLAGTA